MQWRLKDLAAWVYASFGVSLDESTLGRLINRLGFRKLSVRLRPQAGSSCAHRVQKNLPPP